MSCAREMLADTSVYFASLKTWLQRAWNQSTHYDQTLASSRFEAIQTQQQATKPSLTEKWAMTTSKRIAREYGGQLLDNIVKFESKPFATLAQKAAPLTSQARGYTDILGMKPALLKATPNVFTEVGRAKLGKAYSYNFSQVKFNNDQFVKKTLIAANLESITLPFQSGKVFLGLSRILGPVLSGIPAITKAIKTYQETGSISSTIKASGIEAGKAITAWEIGNIGAMVGRLIVPVTGPVGLIASYIFMGLFSAAAYKSMH